MFRALSKWWYSWRHCRNEYMHQRPRLKAKWYLDDENYIKAAPWLKKMIFEENVKEVATLMLPHIRRLVELDYIRGLTGYSGDEVGIHCTIGKYRISNIPFAKKIFVGIMDSALQEVGGLGLAKKAAIAMGDDIPDKKLLAYAQMCANKMLLEDAKTTCRQLKHIDPLDGYKECLGENVFKHETFD